MLAESSERVGRVVEMNVADEATTTAATTTTTITTTTTHDDNDSNSNNDTTYQVLEERVVGRWLHKASGRSYHVLVLVLSII